MLKVEGNVSSNCGVLSALGMIGTSSISDDLFFDPDSTCTHGVP